MISKAEPAGWCSMMTNMLYTVVMNIDVQTRNTRLLYKPLVLLNEVYTEKTMFRLPFSLIPNYSSFAEIIEYLKKEKIIKEIYFLPTRQDVLPHVSILIQSTNEVTGGSMTAIKGNEKESLSIAIGEALERHFLSSSTLSKTVTKNITHSDPLLSHLINFPSFIPEQKDLYSKISSTSPHFFTCVEVSSLMNDTKKWLPSQYIFWKDPHDEVALVNSTTNGAGGHFTKEAAILSGLSEEIERDTFLLHWLAKKTPLKIDLYTLQNKELKKNIEELQAKGIHIYILYLENDFNIPVFVSLLFDKRTSPFALSIGCSVKVTSHERAIHNALCESISVLTMNLSHDGPRRKSGDTAPFSDITITRNERILMWYGDHIERDIDFFLQGKVVDLSTLPIYTGKSDSYSLLNYMIKKLQEKNISDILYYEVNSGHLKKIGYHVVKVVVPEFLQLYLKENLATLSSPRLAHALGKSRNTMKLSDLNLIPHPFP